MENSMDSPQEIKTRTTVLSINPSSGYLSKGNEKQDFEELLAPLCLLQYY